MYISKEQEEQELKRLVKGQHQPLRTENKKKTTRKT